MKTRLVEETMVAVRICWCFDMVTNGQSIGSSEKVSRLDSLFNCPYEDDSCIQGLACIESINHISTTALNMVFVHMVEVLLWKDGTYRRVQGIFVFGAVV